MRCLNLDTFALRTVEEVENNSRRKPLCLQYFYQTINMENVSAIQSYRSRLADISSPAYGAIIIASLTV